MHTQRLQSALSAIVHPSTAPGVALGEAIQTLDAILLHEGDQLDPQLRHYLRQRSYQKALDYLRGPTTPHRP